MRLFHRLQTAQYHILGHCVQPLLKLPHIMLRILFLTQALYADSQDYQTQLEMYLVDC